MCGKEDLIFHNAQLAFASSLPASPCLLLPHKQKFLAPSLSAPSSTFSHSFQPLFKFLNAQKISVNIFFHNFWYVWRVKNVASLLGELKLSILKKLKIFLQTKGLIQNYRNLSVFGPLHGFFKSIPWGHSKLAIWFPILRSSVHVNVNYSLLGTFFRHITF